MVRPGLWWLCVGLAVVTGEPLGEERVAEIFDRLPELDDDAGDQTDFNPPPQSLPPPQAGATVDAPFPAGTYTYSYAARATTPGTFVTPPTRAEEIYAPETFGRSATDIVMVEAA